MAAPAMVDVGPTLKDLVYLFSKGWTQAEIARGARVSKGTVHDIMAGSRPMVQKKCAEAIARLRKEEGEGDTRRFPAEPLKQVVLRAYNGKLISSGIARQIHRMCEGHCDTHQSSDCGCPDWKPGDISAKQADYWAVKLGKHPVEIWPNWYEESA